MLQINVTCNASATYPQCDSTIGLRCISSMCRCPSYNYYDGSRCLPLLTLNYPCPGTFACNTTLGLLCINSACQCNSSQYWNGAFCSKKNKTRLFYCL